MIASIAIEGTTALPEIALGLDRTTFVERPYSIAASFVGGLSIREPAMVRPLDVTSSHGPLLS